MDDDDDPMEGHFASNLWHGCVRLWRWRLDINLWSVETSRTPEGARGYELGVHVWRMPR